ncbi:hypothetical protein ACL1FZ_06100 [Corynebacterium striatum]
MNTEAVTSEALEMTLKELGWIYQESSNPRMSLWIPSAVAKLEPTTLREEAGVFLPQYPDSPDFDRLIHRAVNELAELSADNVLEELAFSRLRIKRDLDKFVVSTDGPAVQSGIVDWRRGANLINGLSEILKSGARVTHDPKRWFRGASRVVADNYLDSCLMGQTEVGSYVVKAFVPAGDIVPVSNSARTKNQSQMTARHVSKTVFASLQATLQALEDFQKNHDTAAFEWGMTQGVSVEMLTGVRELLGTDETEVSLECASADASDTKNKPYRGTLVLEPTLREAVEVGVETMRKSPPPTRVTIVGEVTVLMRECGEPNSRRIKMRGHAPDGRARVYTVHLNQEDYDKALEAHGKQVLFRVEGKADKGKFTEVAKVHVTRESVSGELSRPQDEVTEQLDLLNTFKY